MLIRTLLTICALALAAPAAGAADTTVAPDTAARQVTALDGTVVWVSGEFGAQVLMQHSAAGTAPLTGAPPAAAYSSIDLGHDAGGRLVLTYLRCAAPSRCVARRDDLHGHRAGFRGLTPAGCSLSTAPALWRDRAAYGVGCRRSARRSGLYVRTGSGAPRRLPLPGDAVKYGITTVTSVDLRGTRVAAVAADIYEYAFAETVAGTRRESFLAAASEGESDEHARGLALGPSGALWTLVDAEHVGDPNQAIVHRLAGGCRDWQVLFNAPGPDEESGYRAIDLAVDGDAIYLVVPQTGIVSHEFAPDRACAPA
jgi:hypothetical protein